MEVMEEIFEALKSNTGIYTTKILKQRWKNGSFSYLATPRPDFGIMLLTRGSLKLRSENGTLSAEEGNIVFLPKNCRYESVFSGIVEDYLVCFEITDAHIPSDMPIKITEGASLSCISRFRELVEENYSPTHTRLQSKGLFFLLLDAIISNVQSESVGSRLVTIRVCEMLRSDTDLSIAEIAKECAVSESGLRRIFKEQMGISPIRYRLNFKLKRAKFLLDSTDMSVGEIAERLNFFDAAYFCNVFKRHVGMTPMQYTKNRKL